MRRQDRMVVNIDEIKRYFKQHAYYSPRYMMDADYPYVVNLYISGYEIAR